MNKTRQTQWLRAVLFFLTSLVVTACGSGGGGGGGGNSGGGTSAGFLVVEHKNPANPVENGIRVYRADQPNAPISEIAGAEYERDEAGKPMKVGSLGVAYGIPDPVGTTEYRELGIFVSSVPVVLGAQVNHRYRWFGLIPSSPPRVVFRDRDELGVYHLQSANLDGGDVRPLLIDCTLIQAPSDAGPEPVISSAGIVFRARKGGVLGWYYSDGVGPAVKLFYTGDDNVRVPEALFANGAVLYYPASAHLTRQVLDGVTGEFDLFEVDTANVSHFLETDPTTGKLAVGPGGELVVRRFKTSVNQTRILVVRYDGTVLVDGGYTNDGLFPYAEQASLHSLSPDGTKLISLFLNADGSQRDDLRIIPFSGPTGTAMDLLGDHARYARWLPNGKILVNKCEPASCSQAAAATGNFIATAAGVIESGKILSQTFQPLAASGIHAVLLDPAAVDLTTIDSVGLTTPYPAGALCTSCSDPKPTTRADGYVTFVDDAGAGWIANLPAGTPPVRIDNIPTTNVIHVGEGSGNRLFFTMQRKAGDHDVVVFDLDTQTATTLIGGPADDTGFFFPN